MILFKRKDNMIVNFSQARFMANDDSDPEWKAIIFSISPLQSMIRAYTTVEEVKKAVDGRWNQIHILDIEWEKLA